MIFASFRRRIRKMGVALAFVGLFAGATASPALANHNSGNGNKVGHENGNGQKKGHAKQDARDNDAPLSTQEACEAAGGTWFYFGELFDGDGNSSPVFVCAVLG